jgi:hypothetical protein
MVSVKLRRSAGSAKCVFIVDGKSSSVRSKKIVIRFRRVRLFINDTFLDPNLSCAGLGLLLRCSILILLHAPYLGRVSQEGESLVHTDLDHDGRIVLAIAGKRVRLELEKVRALGGDAKLFDSCTPGFGKDSGSSLISTQILIIWTPRFPMSTWTYSSTATTPIPRSSRSAERYTYKVFAFSRLR